MTNIRVGHPFMVGTIKGAAAVTVVRGVDGKSAYELAVAHGFDGTEQEWLDTLGADLSGLATQGELQAESSARSQADAALDSRVGALESIPTIDLSPYATDADLASEAEARSAADTAIDLRLDTLEAVPPPDLSGYATLDDLEQEIADVNATLTTVTNATSGHVAATTNVHGIADTAALVVTTDPRLEPAISPVPAPLLVGPIVDQGDNLFRHVVEWVAPRSASEVFLPAPSIDTSEWARADWQGQGLDPRWVAFSLDLMAEDPRIGPVSTYASVYFLNPARSNSLGGLPPLAQDSDFELEEGLTYFLSLTVWDPAAFGTEERFDLAPALSALDAVGLPSYLLTEVDGERYLFPRGAAPRDRRNAPANHVHALNELASGPAWTALFTSAQNEAEARAALGLPVSFTRVARLWYEVVASSATLPESLNMGYAYPDGDGLYEFEVWVVGTTAAATTGARVSVDFNGGQGTAVIAAQNSATSIVQALGTTAANFPATTGTAALPFTLLAHIRGVFRLESGLGAPQVYVRSEVQGSAVTVSMDSFMTYRRVGD